MAHKIIPISQAEMARQLERLKEKRVEGRYTIHDMSILTGWSHTYLMRLEKDSRIPRAERVGPKRGDPKRKARGIRRWGEDQARVILGFMREQEEKFVRVKSGA